jgi:hypothetical protein
MKGDPQDPVKPFLGGGLHRVFAACPGCGYPPAALTYLETLARQWQAADPPLLLVPKARRMRLTWLFCALHTWLAGVRP